VNKKLENLTLDELAAQEESNEPEVQEKIIDEDGFEITITKSKKEESKEEPKQKENISEVEAETISDSQLRYYELSITYDFYHHTPHLWMAGYTEDGIPLKDQEMYEDIMDEYAKKTVTCEIHPHIGTHQLSLHPCRHASVMKNLIDLAKDNGAEVEPHHALFIFLKFLSSVIPTMEYDFSLSYELGAK